jgi:hypothetical protein
MDRETKPRFKFLATCRENCLAESSNNHTPSVQFMFDVTAELVPGQPPKLCSRNLRADLWLTDATYERTFKTLAQVFGWNGDDIEEINNRSLFQGTPVTLVCEEEEYNGETQMKVVFINPQSSVYAVKPERAAQIAEEFKGKLAAFRSKTKSASRTAADLATAPEDSVSPQEDLPF